MTLLETELLALTGADTLEQALSIIKDALVPTPKQARVGIVFDDVDVRTLPLDHPAAGDEHRQLRARARFRDGTIRSYQDNVILAAKVLRHHGEADKLRTYTDNRMRNRLTEMVMQDAG